MAKRRGAAAAAENLEWLEDLIAEYDAAGTTLPTKLGAMPPCHGGPLIKLKSRSSAPWGRHNTMGVAGAVASAGTAVPDRPFSG